MNRLADLGNYTYGQLDWFRVDIQVFRSQLARIQANQIIASLLHFVCILEKVGRSKEVKIQLVHIFCTSFVLWVTTR